MFSRPSEPLVLVGLVAIAVASYLGVRYPDTVFPGDHEARAHVLQLAAGLVVAMGAYFTALGLAFNRAQKRLELLGQAVDRLTNRNEATRLSAIWTLEAIARDAPRNRGEERLTRSVHRAIYSALQAVDSEDGAVSEACREVRGTLGWLDPSHFPR